MPLSGTFLLAWTAWNVGDNVLDRVLEVQLLKCHSAVLVLVATDTPPLCRNLQAIRTCRLDWTECYDHAMD